MRRWDEDVVPHIRTAADLGFDGVELSLLSMDRESIRRIRRALAETGLEVTCTTGLAAAEDVTSDDPAVRAAGTEALRRAVESASSLGSQLLSGVLYAPWGRRLQTRRNERWHRAVEALAYAGDVAQAAGVRLGIEAINRYETDLVNTAEQARRMAIEVDRHNVGVLLDTYHMNIEEKDIGAAIRTCGEYLMHLHVVGNDRGTPGSGHLPWGRIVPALRDVGYEGWATLELFIQANQEVSPDLCVWRSIEPDPTEAARQGRVFLSGELA
jgi:D-psicose/D-tagatose/L-ribulose 3-epimerase